MKILCAHCAILQLKYTLSKGVIHMIEGMPDKLKELRRNIGLSQKEVADHLGISASIVAGYETGYRTPSTEVLVKLSSLYYQI